MEFPIKSMIRYVRAYREGAGMEYDVNIINGALLARYPLHIIHVHLAKPEESLAVETVEKGLGRITYVPVLRDVLPAFHDQPGKQLRRALKVGLRDKLLSASVLLPLVKVLAARRPVCKPGDVDNLQEVLEPLVARHAPELMMIHAGGGLDAWDAMEVARRHRIPRGMVLHFANARYLDGSVRLQTHLVNACAGVSEVDVPDYLQGDFTSLYPPVETEKYAPLASVTRSEPPVLFLPARIVPSKGHDDLLAAATELRRRGRNFQVVIAGRTDQPDYEVDLKRRIAAASLETTFKFVGMLDATQMIEQYRRSYVLAFPTYHHEGCPRIVLEAAACGLPSVTYDTGGTRAAIQQGITGIVRPTGDLAGFISSIDELLENPNRIETMGNAAREFITSKFGTEQILERHLRFYSMLIDREG